MTINELIKDLETIKARFCDSNDNEDDIEVFIPETIILDNYNKRTILHECEVSACGTKHGIIALINKGEIKKRF